MNAERPKQLTNPLERTAEAIPAGVASSIALATKLAASAIALFVAFDESYDETQVFGVCIAVIGLLTIIPARGKLNGAWSVFGAAMLFYAGALLFNVSAGPGLLAVGAIATAASLVTNHHRGGSAGLAVAVLFGAMVAITALVLGIVFAVGG